MKDSHQMNQACEEGNSSRAKSYNCKCCPFAKLHQYDCPAVIKRPCPVHGRPICYGAAQDVEGSDQCVVYAFHPNEKICHPFRFNYSQARGKLSYQDYSSRASSSSVPDLMIPNPDDLRRNFVDSCFVKKTKSFVADKTNKMKKLKQCFHSPCSSIIQKTQSNTSLRERMKEVFREEAKRRRDVAVSVQKSDLNGNFETVEDLEPNLLWCYYNNCEMKPNMEWLKDKTTPDYLTTTPESENMSDTKTFEVQMKRGVTEFPKTEKSPLFAPFVYYSSVEDSERKNQSKSQKKKDKKKTVVTKSDKSPYDSNDKRDKPENTQTDYTSSSDRSLDDSSGSAYYTPFILVPAGSGREISPRDWVDTANTAVQTVDVPDVPRKPHMVNTATSYSSFPEESPSETSKSSPQLSDTSTVYSKIESKSQVDVATQTASRSGSIAFAKTYDNLSEEMSKWSVEEDNSNKAVQTGDGYIRKSKKETVTYQREVQTGQSLEGQMTYVEVKRKSDVRLSKEVQTGESLAGRISFVERVPKKDRLTEEVQTGSSLESEMSYLDTCSVKEVQTGDSLVKQISFVEYSEKRVVVKTSTKEVQTGPSTDRQVSYSKDLERRLAETKEEQTSTKSLVSLKCVKVNEMVQTDPKISRDAAVEVTQSNANKSQMTSNTSILKQNQISFDDPRATCSEKWTQASGCRAGCASVNAGASDVTYVVKPFASCESDQAIEKQWGKCRSDSDLVVVKKECDCCQNDSEIPLPKARECKHPCAVVECHESGRNLQNMYKVYDSDRTICETTTVWECNDNASPVRVHQYVENTSQTKRVTTREEGNNTSLSDLSDLSKIINDLFNRMSNAQVSGCECGLSCDSEQKVYVDEGMTTDSIEESDLVEEVQTFPKSACASQDPFAPRSCPEQMKFRTHDVYDNCIRYICQICKKKWTCYTRDIGLSTSKIEQCAVAVSCQLLKEDARSEKISSPPPPRKIQEERKATKSPERVCCAAKNQQRCVRTQSRQTFVESPHQKSVKNAPTQSKPPPKPTPAIRTKPASGNTVVIDVPEKSDKPRVSYGNQEPQYRPMYRTPTPMPKKYQTIDLEEMPSANSVDDKDIQPSLPATTRPGSSKNSKVNDARRRQKPSTAYPVIIKQKWPTNLVENFPQLIQKTSDELPTTSSTDSGRSSFTSKRNSELDEDLPVGKKLKNEEYEQDTESCLTFKEKEEENVCGNLKLRQALRESKIPVAKKLTNSPKTSNFLWSPSSTPRIPIVEPILQCEKSVKSEETLNSDFNSKLCMAISLSGVKSSQYKSTGTLDQMNDLPVQRHFKCSVCKSLNFLHSENSGLQNGDETTANPFHTDSEAALLQDSSYSEVAIDSNPANWFDCNEEGLDKNIFPSEESVKDETCLITQNSTDNSDNLIAESSNTSINEGNVFDSHQKPTFTGFWFTGNRQDEWKRKRSLRSHIRKIYKKKSGEEK